MKIGIGVTTYNRPTALKYCMVHLKEFALNNKTLEEHEISIVVGDDTEDPLVSNINAGLCEGIATYLKNPTARGISCNKNQCLRLLQNCDRIFLFDDDTFPINEDWVDKFLLLTSKHGIHHAMYLQSYGPDIDHIQPVQKQSDFVIYNHCLGCMLYMTKDALNAVGGFDERMARYGYEHAQWTVRYHMISKSKGFAHTTTPFVSIPNIRDYIFSTDVNSNPNKGKLDQSPILNTEEVIASHCRSLRDVSDTEINAWVTHNSALYHNIDKVKHKL